MVIDVLTTPDLCKDLELLVRALLRDQDSDRLPDNFFGVVAEEPFCRPIVGSDDAVKIFTQDRIFGRFYDRNQALLVGLYTFALGNVRQHVDGANQSA